MGRFAIVGWAALLVGGCQSRTLGGGTGGTGGGAGPAADCGAIEELPPIVTVADASNDQPVCDPTFFGETVGDFVTWSSIDGFQCDGTASFGCPTFSTTAQPRPCIFALVGVGPGSHTVKIEAPGHAPTQIDGVTGGQSGCVPYKAASQLTVSLALNGAGDGAAP